MTFLIVISALIGFAIAGEVCYPPCGCFNDAPPFNTRPLPEGWEQAPIVWLLYTQNNRNNPQEVTLPDIQAPSQFDPTKPTEFLIHGWTSNRNSLQRIKDAILDRYDHNVFVVDWSEGADSFYYPQSASNTQVVGACSAYVAAQLTDLGTVHCIGHSLGGQTCGYMGLRSGATLRRATGLDPAGPWFDSADMSLRIDASDAQFVDLLHTNGRFYGIGRAIGHADFFPNKAQRQPGCDSDGCDHEIVVDFFMASISAADQCEFNAYPCDSNVDADAGLCNSCSGDCQKMGWYADTMPGEGAFFLTTVAGYPYCAN